MNILLIVDPRSSARISSPLSYTTYSPFLRHNIKKHTINRDKNIDLDRDAFSKHVFCLYVYFTGMQNMGFSEGLMVSARLIEEFVIFFSLIVTKVITVNRPTCFRDSVAYFLLTFYYVYFLSYILFVLIYYLFLGLQRFEWYGVVLIK